MGGVKRNLEEMVRMEYGKSESGVMYTNTTYIGTEELRTECQMYNTEGCFHFSTFRARFKSKVLLV